MGGSQPASKPKKTSTMHLKPLASCATRRRQALPPSSLRPATLPKEDTHYLFRASDQLCYPWKTSTIFPEPACCAIRRRQALSLARRLAGCSIQAGGVGARLVSGRKNPGLDGCPGIHQSISPVPHGHSLPHSPLSPSLGSKALPAGSLSGRLLRIAESSSTGRTHVPGPLQAQAGHV